MLNLMQNMQNKEEKLIAKVKMFHFATRQISVSVLRVKFKTHLQRYF